MRVLATSPTGNPWSDGLLIAAAIVAAIWTIWVKALRPVVHMAKRIERIVDLSDELPPTMVTVLLAMPGRFDELSAQIARVDGRIDSHMETEEHTIVSINEKMESIVTNLDEHVQAEEEDLRRLDRKVDSIGKTLEQRSALFEGLQGTLEQTQDIIATHMAQDESQFAAAGKALVDGQTALLARLNEIERLADIKGDAREVKNDAMTTAIESLSEHIDELGRHVQAYDAPAQTPAHEPAVAADQPQEDAPVPLSDAIKPRAKSRRRPRAD